MPGQALRAPEGWTPRISKQKAQEGGKVVNPMHQPPLPPGDIPGTHFCYRMNRPQGHTAAGRIKSIPMTLITNQSRDLPACSAVPKPTVPPHTPK